MIANRALGMLALAVMAGCFGGCAPPPKNEFVEIDTSLGKIKVELFTSKAPKTVANFLSYVDEKFYDGLIFHRVMETFVIQGGGYTPQFEEKKTKPPIRNEADNGLSNLRGTITMARTRDPHSASAQFFINVNDNIGLDKAHDPDQVGYCVFGRVVDGMDVVDKIRAVPTWRHRTTTGEPLDNLPIEPVIINSIRRVPDAATK
jgi:cyclophilin family peptidyl-prolyl cis-trans isomerase